MIRPFTLICMASAFGAGLYLYQSKHTAQVLDREITRTMKQTETTRERTGMLRAEWAVLNEPDRLAELARQHLQLQTLKPTQFAAMNDLGARLPAPVAARHEPLPAEPEPEDAAVPVAQATPPAAPPPAATKVASAPEPKAKPDTKPDSKPEAKSEPKQVAEAKPVAKPAERPVDRVAERPAERPIERPVVARLEPPHPRPPAPPTTMASNEATAPGTVGAAVLRAMRARAAEESASAPPPSRAYAQPAYVQPASNPASYAQQAYAPQAYARPAYPTQAYAPQPASSVLGGRSALPPPVPFAVR